jgi:hypothetical protein
MLRTAELLPPTRLSTLGFDPTRFQTEPPVCYRASWQLPGRDSRPLATMSFTAVLPVRAGRGDREGDRSVVLSETSLGGDWRAY